MMILKIQKQLAACEPCCSRWQICVYPLL